MDSSGREDPPASYDDSSHLPDQSVEVFRAVPAPLDKPVSSSVESLSHRKTGHTAVESANLAPDVLEDLRKNMQARTASGEVRVKKTPPSSPIATKLKKKRSTTRQKSSESKKNSKAPGTKTKRKKKTSSSNTPQTPLPKKKEKSRDVLLTSVHLKDIDESERTDLSEITTPAAIRPPKIGKGADQKQLETAHKDNIIWEESGDLPVSPTEEMTETPISLYKEAITTKELDSKDSRQVQRLRSIPRLHETSQQNLLEQQVFAVALPQGPSGLYFKQGEKYPVISTVSGKSPLFRVVEPGLFAVGLHLPKDGNHKSETYTDLHARDLSQTLRQSPHRRFRLLWLTKKSNEEVSKSWMATMSAVWRTNDIARSFSVTPTKMLISLPATDLGLTLVGEPPIIYSLSPTSPLQGLLPAGGESRETLYVKSLYCAETGDQWDGLDSHHLNEMLRSTSNQHMRVLAVTTSQSEIHTDHSTTISYSDKSFMGDPIAKKDKSTKILEHATSGLQGSLNRLSEVLAKTDMAEDGKSKTPMKHIIVKRSCRSKGVFGFGKAEVISFHGLAMNQDVASAVQRHLDKIKPSARSKRLFLEPYQSRKSSMISYTAVIEAEYQKYHSEDALVAVMDAMAETGWTLKCPFDLSQSRGTSDLFFVFTK